MPSPLPTDVEHVELQVFPAGSQVSLEPPHGSADLENHEVDEPLPLGFKLTGYRLLNLAMFLAFGLSKFILSLQGHSVAPTALDWVAGSVLAAL
jgi:hypothetical protein